MSNPIADARGDELLFGGTLDPTVTALAAPRGAFYIRAGATIGLYQKLDDGKTTNWELKVFSGGSAAMETDFNNAVASVIDIDLGTNKVVNLSDPTAAQDAATKNYVDTIVAAIDFMQRDFSNAQPAANDIDFNNNKALNVGAPTNAGDGANKNYTDTQDALKVSKAGDSMTGDLDMSSSAKVINLAAPTNNNDAARKIDVDAVAAGQVTKLSCQYISSANLANILTANQAAVEASLDQTGGPYVLANGDRILYKDQTTTSENGIYVWDGANLSRASDFDGAPGNEVKGGDTSFVINGDTFGGISWRVTGSGPINVGTDPIVWTEASSSGSFADQALSNLASVNFNADISTTGNFNFVSGSGTPNQIVIGAQAGSGPLPGIVSSSDLSMEAANNIVVIPNSGTGQFFINALITTMTDVGNGYVLNQGFGGINPGDYAFSNQANGGYIFSSTLSGFGIEAENDGNFVSRGASEFLAMGTLLGGGGSNPGIIASTDLTVEAPQVAIQIGTGNLFVNVPGGGVGQVEITGSSQTISLNPEGFNSGNDPSIASSRQLQIVAADLMQIAADNGMTIQNNTAGSLVIEENAGNSFQMQAAGGEIEILSTNLKIDTGKLDVAESGNEIRIDADDLSISSTDEIALKSASGTPIKLETDNEIQFIDQSLAGASVGYIWTLQNDTTGEGAWAAAPAGGANTTLSNLTNPTAVNQNLNMTSNVVTGVSATFGIPYQFGNIPGTIQGGSNLYGVAATGFDGFGNLTFGTLDGAPGNTGGLKILTGNGGAISGPITIRTGTGSGANRGSISIDGYNVVVSAAGRFDASNSSGPFRAPNLSADPGAPANGDLWYNTTSNQLKAYVNGAVVVIA